MAGIVFSFACVSGNYLTFGLGYYKILRIENA